MEFRGKTAIHGTDVLIAVGALVLIVPLTYAGISSMGPDERAMDPLGLLLIVLGCVALAFRRTHTTPACIVATVSTCVYYALNYPGHFAVGPALVAIFTASLLGRRRLAIGLALAMAAGAYGTVALSDADPSGSDGVTVLGGWLVAVVIVGEVTKNRRAYLREVVRRAEEAERTREETALRRASEERVWIAQELHDTLTHTISVINVQSAVALELLDRDPERARAAMSAVKESGGEAMRELRATLGVLRQADPDGPGAGLARLPRLVARAEAAGLPVVSEVKGEPLVLPPEVDRAAYRIVQEAFTNVLRHAGPATIALTIEYLPDSVVVRVEDDGSSSAPAGTQGMGLIGMRERAVAVRGTLTAGPRPEGGFAIRAELPHSALPPPTAPPEPPGPATPEASPAETPRGEAR